jgi:hypothetical protein
MLHFGSAEGAAGDRISGEQTADAGFVDAAPTDDAFLIVSRSVNK